jgi:hypothetical protein
MSHHFRAAVEAKDLDRMRDVLREDVVLHSPVTFRPFEGRDAVMFILGNVVEILEDFRYTAELVSGDQVVLRFTARAGDREIEGIDFLDLDADGKVAELTVLMRPLSALTRFAELMGERVGAKS